MDRLIVNHVRNPLDPLLDREIREYAVGTSVLEILASMRGHNAEARSDRIVPPEDGITGKDGIVLPIEGNWWESCVVNVNGMILSEKADLANCRPTGTVVICPVPQGGGGGSNVLRIVAMIAVIVVAAAVTYGVGAYAAGGAWAWGAGTYAGATGAAAYAGIAAGAAVMMTGSLLVNALLPVNLADPTGQTSDFSNSATYGWNVEGNADTEGVPWPVLHGTHRITPPIIGKYVETVGDKQFLNILYAVADHKIDSIDETSIEINGNAAAQSEDDGLTWEYRLGDIDQSVIQYFHDTRSAKTVGTKIGTGWTTAETDGNAVEGLGIALTLPKGLYYAADNGSLAEQSVNLDIEYRTTGAGDWTPVLRTYNATLTTVSSGRWSGGYKRDVTGLWGYNSTIYIEFEQGSGNPADHVEGDPYAPGGGMQIVGVPAIPDIVLRSNRTVWQWSWVTAESTVYAAGTLASEHVQITGSQTSPLRRVYYIDRLPAGAYEVRVRFQDGIAPPSGSRYANDVWIEYIEEIIYDDFTYPGTALFALRALATDKLSGGLPTVSFIATRANVSVWTGAAYEDKPANNPAWWAWDVLHNSDYAGGLPHSRIVYADFSAWAAWCETKGYNCNIYSDSIINLRKALDMIGLLGEGSVAQTGAIATCFVDREVDYPVQSFIFNAGNTMRESYSEEYLSMDDRANSVEVTFWDAENGYKRTTLEMPAADFDETTQEIKKTQLTLIGCTSRTEAIKHGNRALNRNRFLTRTATWDAGIDSLGCLPWDPVVPPIGQDGRVVSGTSNSVNIDREVLLQPGHTYYIRVKSADDDTVEEQTVAAVYEETVTATLTVTGNWTHVPVLYELYVFYEEGQDRGLMRVLRISRRDDHTRRITAIEYSADACDDSGTVDAPETPSISHQIANLHAEEVWRGGIETRAQLSWTGFALLWHVWHKRTSDAAYIYDGQTVVPSYEISGLDYSVPYTFCVASTRDSAAGETVALTMMAKTDLPADVSNVQSSLQKYGILITWDEVVEPYKSPVTYEIRYVTGAAPDWDNGIVLANGISGNTWSWEIKVAGDYTVMIKAIDTFGNRSETEASAVVTILAPQQVTPAYSFREEAVTLSWAAPSSSFPILEYRLYYGATFAGAEFVTSRRALDYTERVSWTGTRRWWIQAVDIAGNEGEEAFIDVEVAAPAVVQTLTAQVIDNTVLLRWGAPAAGTLPTASYQVRRGDVFASAFIIGQVSGTFATSFETEAATYKYWVVAIDSAGNYGTESAIQAIVNEPPDYILRADDDLGLLSGTMSNCESYESELLLPVNTTETWEEHFTTRSWVTSQDKIDAGYPLHLTPTPPSAYWELVVDYGTTLPGTMISLLPVLENLYGTVAITPTISWSADGDTWTPYEGMYQVFATQFRYVKYRMDFDPASDLSLAALQTVRAKLDIKLKKDSGSVVIDSTSGVVVTFNRTFIDLAGAPQVQAPYFNNSSIDPAVAVVDFEDAPYPESFTVYLYDKNGTLITSGAKTVSWSAEGY